MWKRHSAADVDEPVDEVDMMVSPEFMEELLLLLDVCMCKLLSELLVYC